MSAELIAKLKYQTATVADASIDEWVELARWLRMKAFESKTVFIYDFDIQFIPVQLIARIQVLLTDAGLLSDEEFMCRLTGAPWFNSREEKV